MGAVTVPILSLLFGLIVKVAKLPVTLKIELARADLIHYIILSYWAILELELCWCLEALGFVILYCYCNCHLRDHE